MLLRVGPLMAISALFLTESAELSLTNIANTKNYNGTFSLGAGTSYNFPVNNYFSIEPALTCSSTIIKRQLNYLSPKLELRFCGHIPGASAIYLGFGLQYIHPYRTRIYSDKDFSIRLGKYFSIYWLSIDYACVC